MQTQNVTNIIHNVHEYRDMVVERIARRWNSLADARAFHIKTARDVIGFGAHDSVEAAQGELGAAWSCESSLTTLRLLAHDLGILDDVLAKLGDIQAEEVLS